jgi:hypothetical protein
MNTKASLVLGLIALQAFSACWASVAQVGTATVYDTASFQNGQSGACNCQTGVGKYPTAALSEFDFGVGGGQGAGPACGRCYRIKAYGDPYGSWCTNSGPEIVVKIADLCPAPENQVWCAGRPGAPNNFGAVTHFDLDEAHAAAFKAGAGGRGAFRIQYCQVPCSEWAGYYDPTAQGTISTTWGSCPNVMGGSSCEWQQLCGSSTPPPPPSSGGNFAVNWNGGTNMWWLAVDVTGATSVSIDCGKGWVQMQQSASWENPRKTWIAENLGYPCPNNVQLLINGNTVQSSVRPN